MIGKKSRWSAIQILVAIYFGLACTDLALLLADHYFLDGALLDDGDKIASITACLITGFGLIFVVIQLSMQANSSDIQSIYLVNSDINQALHRVNLAAKAGDRTEWDFHFRYLLTAFESACYCYNRDMLQDKAKALLGEYLLKGLKDVYSDPALKVEVGIIKGGDSRTMREAELFLRSYGVSI